MGLDLDQVTAAVRTLADHFRAPLPPELADVLNEPAGAVAAHVAEGWESLEQDLEYPTIAIDAPIAGERLGHAPMVLELFDVDDHPEKVDVLIALASVTLPLNIEVFAKSRAERSRVLLAIERSFAAQSLDEESRLDLVSPHYHGRMMGFRRAGPARFADTAGRVKADEWRAIVPVEADIEEVALVRFPRLRELRVGFSYGFATAAMAETIEFRTIFAPE